MDLLCIDTGVHCPELGHLTVAEIQTGTAELHRFACIDKLLEPPAQDLTFHARNAAFIAAMGTDEHPRSFVECKKGPEGWPTSICSADEED